MLLIIINPFRTILITSLITILSLIFFFLFLFIFGENHSNLIITIPFISGYLHTGPDHFFFNIIILYISLLPAVNEKYDYIDIYLITLMLSILYLPFVIAGFCEPAIGISGTCFFLIARYLMSFNKIQLSLLFLTILIVLELYSAEPKDGIAHLVHCLGIITGCISLKRKSIIGISIAPFIEEKSSIEDYVISL